MINYSLNLGSFSRDFGYVSSLGLCGKFELLKWDAFVFVIDIKIRFGPVV